MAMREPRRERRATFDEATRLALLEGDADDMESSILNFQTEMRFEVKSIKDGQTKVIWAAGLATITGALNLIYLVLGKELGLG